MHTVVLAGDSRSRVESGHVDRFCIELPEAEARSEERLLWLPVMFSAPSFPRLLSFFDVQAKLTRMGCDLFRWI